MPTKEIKSVIHAKDTEITVISTIENEDFISLTDIVSYRYCKIQKS